jgi:hypothetical protein
LSSLSLALTPRPAASATRVRSGYVDVDWAKVERVLTGALDADGDGKLTANDARLGLSRLNALLAFNLPGTIFGSARARRPAVR